MIKIKKNVTQAAIMLAILAGATVAPLAGVRVNAETVNTYVPGNKLAKVYAKVAVDEFANVDLTQKVATIKANKAAQVKTVVDRGTDNAPVLQLINGHYITANKDMVVSSKINEDKYFMTNPKIVGAKKATKVYSDRAFKVVVKSLKAGDVMNIKAITWSDGGTPRLELQDGGYATAAKSTMSKLGKSISNYWTVSLGSVKLLKNSYVYKNQNLKKSQRIKKLKKGTKIKIKGLKWSNGGYPRFKVAGGYLTTNKKNTVVASAGTNKVNSYIISNYFGKHAKITKKIDKRFPKNKLRKGVAKPEGVVVHETANPTSTLKNEVKYMKAHYKNAFVHTFVDGSTIENIANTNYLAWGAGYQANQRFIQFEQVRVHSKKNFAKEINNAAYYSAYVLKEYGLKPSLAKKNKTGTLWSHNDVSKWLGGTDHTDPVAYWKASGKKWFGTNYTMKDFYKLVKAYYDAM